MKTRLTAQVLANVHADMHAGHTLAAMENQLIAEIMNRIDEATVDGYDADAAAAALFAFATALRGVQLAVKVDARPEEATAEIVSYVATMAALTGQVLHAQTHEVADGDDPERHGDPMWYTKQPRPWRNLPQSSTAVIEFDKVPWPPDRRERIPLAVVGTAATAYQLEALRQYRSARGLPALLNVIALTASQVNEAVAWWNHRAEMLRIEDPR